MDSFSPLAPSRIRVLVLPVGRIEPKPFSRLLHRLQNEACIIPLADIEPHVAGGDYELSPKSFLPGALQYNFTPAAPSEQHLHLSPYELFREPLLVLGVVGGLHDENETRKSVLGNAASYLRERHPRVVHRQLLVLLNDGDGDEGGGDVSPAIGVVHAEQDSHPALRVAMCKLSARFLVELNTYAKALQASPGIPTPGRSTHGLPRAKVPTESDRRPASGYRTPTRGSDSQSPVDDGSPASPDSRSRGPPPTSFDQITTVGNTPRAPARSNSRASNPSDRDKMVKATANQDRAPVQSKDKLRARGKARVGVVLGSIYMIAGHWKEALPILIEHTTKLRSLSDHLWHGKGLENISICLLLLAWKDVEFQIPALCNPITDRNSASHVPRLSAIIPAEPKSGENAQQAAVRRLAACIPGLSKTILGLYRSVEGSLELPLIAIAESTVRFSKLLAILANCAGDLSVLALQQLATGPEHRAAGYTAVKSAPRPPVFPNSLSRNAIAEMLAQILPRGENTINTPDRIALLSAIASTYALLGLERKKAIVVRELVLQLRHALVHARKLGAAEVGIHPAASISTETGAETLLAIAEESGGINKLMANISEIYGASLLPEFPSDCICPPDTAIHGNPILKFEILREFASLCEASPDPYGVLRLNSSLLRAGGPNSALDANSHPIANALSREEQLQLTTVINRTVAVSKHLGLSDALAAYWDPFLVRGITFPQPHQSLAIIDRTKVKGPVDNRIPGNPLLYDPNASRPGTALPSVFVLVRHEISPCVVTLQNPFDVQLEIESLALVIEGTDLETLFEPTMLGPMRIQSIPFRIHPSSVGDSKITGYRIKIHGCREQIFPIIKTPWSAQTPLTLKDVKAQPQSTSSEPEQLLKSLGIELETVSTTTIDTMPVLVLQGNGAVDSGMMLLVGEKRPLEVSLQNTSSTTAYIFEITDTAGVVRHVRSSTGEGPKARPSTASSDIAIEPGSSTRIHLEITGKAGISSTQVNFYYSVTHSSTSKHARLISFPLQLTVNPALQVQNLDIIPPRDPESDTLQITFDLGNAWPHPLSYTLSPPTSPDLPSPSPSPFLSSQISPGELRRHHLSLPRPAASPSPASDDSLRTSFLSHLRIHWTSVVDDTDDADDARKGHIDLTRLPLSADALSLLRGPPISLTSRLLCASASGVSQHDSSLPISVGAYVQIKLMLAPRGGREGLKGALAVQLVAAEGLGSGKGGERGKEGGDGGNPERRFAVVGALRKVVVDFPGDNLNGNEKVEVDFVVCPLLEGWLEFEAVVHPAGIMEEGSGLGRDEEEDWCVRRKIEFGVEAA